MAAAKEHDSCCDNAEAIRRVEDRMRDDHHELKTGQTNILNALASIRGRVDETGHRLDEAGNDRFSKFEFYWKLGITLAAAVAGIIALYKQGAFS